MDTRLDGLVLPWRTKYVTDSHRLKWNRDLPSGEFVFLKLLRRVKIAKSMLGSAPKHDGKVFGDIPGIPVGTTWKTRQECRMDGVHAMMEHGIHGSITDGAYSVVLSAGYKDDKDSGLTFTYVGSGGKTTKEEPVHRSNVGPQRSHQTVENPSNKALLLSVKTKCPVRVVRGPNPNSPWAPVKGYRYDGLYIVDEKEEDIGEDGFVVIKFKFRRIEGQPALSGSSRKDRQNRMLKLGKRSSRT